MRASQAVGKEGSEERSQTRPSKAGFGFAIGIESATATLVKELLAVRARWILEIELAMRLELMLMLMLLLELPQWSDRTPAPLRDSQVPWQIVFRVQEQQDQISSSVSWTTP